MTRHRFALVGAGFIGSVHAANLADHPNVDFALVYDIDPARAERLARQHGAQPRPSRRGVHRFVQRHPRRAFASRR